MENLCVPGKSAIAKKALTFEQLKAQNIPFKSFKELYNIGDKIGKGAYGKVYKVISHETS